MTTVNLYDNVYGDFASDAEFAVRREAYGEDLGQSSWLTATEWLGFADLLGIRPESEVLEVGSGSGGPAVYLAVERGCRVTGVDINAHGINNGDQLAQQRGLGGRVRFQQVDAARPLPFEPATFDAVISNDAMCHVANRLDVLRDWHRVVRPGGRVLYTDAMVVSGLVSHEELACRSSIGFYLFLPPGENERLIREAGFRLLAAEDVTADEAAISRRWHDARAQREAALREIEGDERYTGMQAFLATCARLAREGRLSRVAYLARKPVSTT